jgi:hypothetical protein
VASHRPAQRRRVQDVGLEFLQDGNGLLLINEVGFKRASSATTRQAWFRTGYLRNSTLYVNNTAGEPQSGNYCAYALTSAARRSHRASRTR